MKKLVIIFVLSLTVVGQAIGQWIALDGSSADGQTKLYIEARDWPADLNGFRIKKHGGDQNWQELHPNPITPQISVDRDWTNLGLNDQQTDEVLTKLNQLISRGKLRSFSETEMLTLLKESGGLRSGDRLSMKNDFQLALIMGFGFIDNNYQKDIDQEYGVFFIDDDGRERQEPLAIYQPQPLDLAFEINFKRLENQVQLSWQMDSAVVKTAGVFSFNLYRGSTANDLQHFGTASVVPVEKNEGINYYQTSDEEADPAQDYFYGIGVVNKFQEEVERIEKAYQAALYGAIPLPDIDTVFDVEEIHSRINWEASWTEEQLNRIEKIVIERAEGLSTEFEKVGETTPDSVFYIDRKKLVYGDNYVYRLKIIGRENTIWYSETYNYLHLGRAQAKTPEFGEALFEMQDETPTIRLTWQEKAENDTITAGYLILADEIQPNEFLELVSVGRVAENTLLRQVGRTAGRTYQFRIVPVNHYGDRAPYLELSVEVAALRLPRFSEFTVNVASGAALQLNWSYPLEVKLHGFNVYMNKTLIADTSEITNDQRDWLITQPVITEDGMVKVQVEAVGIVASVLSRERSLYLPRFKNAAIIPPPDNLKAELKKEKKLRFAEVSWDEPDTGDKALIGYQLWIDVDEEGFLIKQQRLITEARLVYELPDLDRETYTFRVAAVNEDRKQGPPSEVILSLNKKKRE